MAPWYNSNRLFMLSRHLFNKKEDKLSRKMVSNMRVEASSDFSRRRMNLLLNKLKQNKNQKDFSEKLRTC
jgi:hypothetical protein